MARRGELTGDIQRVAKTRLGRAISRQELRLIPYVQYVMVNDQRLDPNKVNAEERKVLSKWRKEGHIEGGAGGLSVTKNFWDSMCEILFHSYVDIE